MLAASALSFAHSASASAAHPRSLGQFFKTRAAVSAALPPRETDKSVRPGMQGSSGAAGPSFSASAGQQQQGFPQPGRGAGLGALLAAHGFSGGAAARGLGAWRAGTLARRSAFPTCMVRASNLTS